jgi:hypothetical protein
MAESVTEYQQNQLYSTEVIMEEIRREIAEKGFNESELKSFHEMQLDTDTPYESMYEDELFEQSLAAMNQDYLLTLDHPLDSNPVKRMIQKIMIKLIRFYVEPVMNRQLTFNIDTVHTMNQTRLYHKQIERDVQQIGQDVEDMIMEQKEDTLRMVKRIQELEEQLQQANERIYTLEQKNI